ncbi:MAG: tripartite tricarboxylate transporter substrate binding protein [Thermodesulfobacteriota bacterium]|nr:tripartite tricarboxylate transporter substrate binding protein [Thermodesulfobacteriota bacterium]
MNQTKRWLLWGLLSTLIIGYLTGSSNPVQSQEKYPTRPIEIIVPYAPGGGTDLSARILAGYLSKRWAVPVNVVNKPGGNTVPACLEVYRAAPDGYTMLQDGLGSGPLLEVVVKNLPFKIMDRTFIGVTTGVAMFIVVPPSTPFMTMKDLDVEAKKDPGNFSWTSLGGAAAQDYTGRKFLKVIGVDVHKTKPIMSQGASQAIVLTAGGNVKMGVGSTSASLPAIKGKTVRGIATTSKQRWPDLPDVPTTAEQGYSAVDVQDRYGPSGPPNLPSHVVEIWNKALEEMVKDLEVLTKMRNTGFTPFYLNAREVREQVIKETEEVRELWGLK